MKLGISMVSLLLLYAVGYGWQNPVGVCTTSGLQLFPLIVSDQASDSGAIIAWTDQRNPDFEVYAKRIKGSDGQIVSQWDNSGNPVSIPPVTPNGHRLGPAVTNGDSGEIIVTWVNHHNFSSPWHSGIYCQKMKDGDPQWFKVPPNNGVGVQIDTSSTNPPSICSDGAGGCVIAVLEGTTIKAYKLFSDGSFDGNWRGSNGLPIRSDPTFVRNVKVIWADSGAYFFWWDYKYGTDNVRFCYKFVYQNGTLESEKTIDSFSNTYGQVFQDYSVCATGNYAYATWIKETYNDFGYIDSLPKKPSYHQIMSATMKCAKLSATDTVWTTILQSASYSPPLDKLSPQMEKPAIASGARNDTAEICITWAMNSKIQACVLDAAGDSTFIGTISASSDTAWNPKVVAKSDTQFIGVWQERLTDVTTHFRWNEITTHRRVYSTPPAFGDSTRYNGNFDVASTPSGAIVTWSENTTDPGDWNIYAQKIDY